MAATDANLGLVWSPTSTTAPYLHHMMSDFISPTINDARNSATKVLSIIPKNTKYYGGKHILERVKYGRNPRQFTNVGDDGNFPDPGQRKMRWYSSRSRQAFARFILQGKLVRAQARDTMANVDPIMDDMDNFLDDYLVDKGRQMYSDGSGRLCEINETGSGTTYQFTMRVNQDIATGLGSPGATTAGCPDQAPTAYLQPGMRVLIITAGGTPKAVCNVDSVDDANQATLTALSFPSGGTAFSDVDGVGTDVLAGDWVVKTGSSDNSSNARMVSNSAWKAEPMGLNGILGYYGPLDGNGIATEVGSNPAASIESVSGYDAYTFGGTDFFGNTNPYYFQGLACHASGIGWESELTFNRGVVQNNSGTPRLPTENLFMRALSTLQETNNAEVQLWLSSYGVRDTYAEQLTGEKRYNDTLELKGGWSPSLVGPAGLPWVVDRMCWHNRVHGLALETGGFTQYVMEDLSWATEQGASIWQYLQDQDKYQARLVEDYQIFVGVRNRCGITILDMLEA
jgi:hypothetical protein